MKSRTNYTNERTICAPITPQGKGAIAVIRLSGSKSFSILDAVFKPIGKNTLSNTKSHTLRYGSVFKPLSDNSPELLDEVLVSVFRAPHSYTGEDSVEISCHGSDYIVQEIIALLISNGAQLAEPGEFTRRAFLNGKMDLTQAEGVADLISGETTAAHTIAIKQMKGGFSKELKEMRKKLLDLVSLMELELDFSEEDVEFADRKRLESLLNSISSHIENLIQSFKLGNVIKNGVPVAIIGMTNTGKSTLLNSLLGEDRAIVSNIHGTTRDSIEDTVNIDGTVFRFIDTAGLRETEECVEKMGIERTYSKMRLSSLLLLVLDSERPESFDKAITSIEFSPHLQKLVILLNKADKLSTDLVSPQNPYISTLISSIRSICETNQIVPYSIIPISAKYSDGMDNLRETLAKSQKGLNFPQNSTLITNLRHYEALKRANDALNRVKEGLQKQIPTDLLTQDINETLYHIGSITGEVTTEEILGNIFKNFCVGK